jgi:ribosomal protein L18E
MTKRTFKKVPVRKAKEPTAANREAIRLIEQFANEPPSVDESFWRDFSRELQRERMSLRKTS